MIPCKAYKKYTLLLLTQVNRIYTRIYKFKQNSHTRKINLTGVHQFFSLKQYITPLQVINHITTMETPLSTERVSTLAAFFSPSPHLHQIPLLYIIKSEWNISTNKRLRDRTKKVLKHDPCFMAFVFSIVRHCCYSCCQLLGVMQQSKGYADCSPQAHTTYPAHSSIRFHKG